jgi:Gram-negative bacterial TonB protein C-terminal
MACLAVVSAASVGVFLASRTSVSEFANPEDVHIADGFFVSDYFGLRYRVPNGWSGGLSGPDPSQSGYYILGTWAPERTFSGTILLVAQDMFFTPDTSIDVKDVVTSSRDAISSVDGMTIDREPEAVKVGGYQGYRIDFSGVGLFRSMFAIKIRCHVVTFNLTSRDPELLESLARSLDDLAWLENNGRHPPECLKDHVSENVLHRIEPDGINAMTLSIPVRMVVAMDGSVKHVHVIRAPAEQRRSIEAAVKQWRFRPFLKQGRPVEVETGVIFGRRIANM